MRFEEAFLWADGLIKKRLESRIAIVVDKQDIEYATIIGKHMKMNFYSLAAQEKYLNSQWLVASRII